MSVDNRELRGYSIAQAEGQISRLDSYTYTVKSQSLDLNYQVKSTALGWICSCPDYVYRELKCKHIYAVEFSLELRKLVQQSVTIQPITALVCQFCESEHIVKKAMRYNKYGEIQRYLCKNCGRRFSINLGFEKMKATPQVITSAMQLYFTGESLRNVKKFLRLQGVKVSHVTIYKWIGKYSRLMERYLDHLTPQVSNVWRTDELYLKVKGNMKYLFALMDDDTRFWLAQQVADTKGTSNVRPLFREGKRIAGKSPKILISDGASNFHEAFGYVFGRPFTQHIQDIRLDGTVHNNKMERLNGEVRDREKVMRGLKKPDTPILTGYQIFHNYFRPHEGLKGQTPADRCGIKVEGENKWITLIQNASHDPKVNRSIYDPKT